MAVKTCHVLRVASHSHIYRSHGHFQRLEAVEKSELLCIEVWALGSRTQIMYLGLPRARAIFPSSLNHFFLLAVFLNRNFNSWKNAFFDLRQFCKLAHISLDSASERERASSFKSRMGGGGGGILPLWKVFALHVCKVGWKFWDSAKDTFKFNKQFGKYLAKIPGCEGMEDTSYTFQFKYSRCTSNFKPYGSMSMPRQQYCSRSSCISKCTCLLLST